MRHASRLVIARQGVMTAFCAFCVGSGLQCSVCYNLFVVGDLRVSLKNAPENERIHFFCLDFVTERSPEQCDMFQIDYAEPRDEGGWTILRAGRIAAKEIEKRFRGHECLEGYTAVDREDYLMARIVAGGYLVNLHDPELALPPHKSHIGPSSSPLCDFCQAKTVARTLECENFAWPVTGSPGEIPLIYDGAWRCCDVCESFVTAKDHVALAKRAMENNEPVEKDSERRRRHFEGLYRKVIETRAEEEPRS